MMESAATLITRLRLAERLQQLTETLAATRTQTEVLDAALWPTMQALDAVAGAVLLLDAGSQHLSLAATRGQGPRTVWQSGPLSPETPAGDALVQQQPRYFEHAAALTAAYPDLEPRTGATVAGATAVLPLMLAGQPLGVLVLDFEEPHEFSAAERRFLATLARQTSVALDRAQVVQTLRASEERFRQLIEVSPVGMAMGALDGHLSLVNDGYLDLLGYTRGQFEAGEINWQALTPPEYQAQDQAAFAQAFREGQSQPYDRESLTRAGTRVPLRVTLVRVDERQVVGYVQDLRQEQQLRAEGQRLEDLVTVRTAGQQAFVDLTQASADTHDVYVLAQEAVQALRTVLGNVSVAYYELDDQCWQAKVWSPDIAPGFLAPMQAGLPADTPRFASAVAAGEPIFIDSWNPAHEGLPADQRYGTVASYPYLMNGQPRGLLSLGLRDRQTWQPHERVIIQAVGRTLGLALQRTEETRQLQGQKHEAERRSQALEAFAELTTELDVRLDPLLLIRRAQEIALSLLPAGYAAYFEPIDGRWRSRSQVGDCRNAELQAAIDAGFPVGQTPTLDWPYEHAQPHFVSAYVSDTDIDPEVAGHLKAAACLPIILRGEVIGIFNVPLFDTREWSPADRAVLVSTVRSLGLALEGGRSIAALAQRSTELEQVNAELQTSNQELEAFSYSASHDLRTPVRHVKGFAELAVRALEDTPNPKAQRHLRIISEAADRMNAMIDAMLLLSRAGRTSLHLRALPLGPLVEQAQADAQLEFPAQAIDWQLGKLPTVRADSQTLQQVLTNLLSNAVKYSSTRPRSVIRIWAEERPGEVAILVQDNGVGFDPQYVGKLFGAFQRLHQQTEFVGSGIGLATVRRIVTRHGGRVWAEGRPGEGATFGFSLPLSPGAAHDRPAVSGA